MVIPGRKSRTRWAAVVGTCVSGCLVEMELGALGDRSPLRRSAAAQLAPMMAAYELIDETLSCCG